MYNCVKTIFLRFHVHCTRYTVHSVHDSELTFLTFVPCKFIFVFVSKKSVSSVFLTFVSKINASDVTKKIIINMNISLIKLWIYIINEPKYTHVPQDVIDKFTYKPKSYHAC